MIVFEALTVAMGELDEDAVKGMLEKVMAEDPGRAQDALDACQRGMDIVGRNFEAGEYFVGDLIYAGELMSEAVDLLKDGLIAGESGDVKTRIILCTVKDDLHDIGKNIVRSMLEAAGFDVLDLGIDTPAERIVNAVKENDIRIVALSGVLTLALDSMKAAIQAIRDAGLKNVKVIVGGAPVDETACAVTGADEWARSPQKTVQVCKQWALA